MLDLTNLESQIVKNLLEISPRVLKEFHGSHEIEEKLDYSIVTDTDKSIENLLKERFAHLVNDSYFLGEENSNMSREQYRSIFDHEYIWAIDPIDGTTNFSVGNPFFAISIGLLRKNKDGHIPVAGAVLFPAMNEIVYTQNGKSYSMHLDTEEFRELKAPLYQNGQSIIMLSESFYKNFELNFQACNVQPRQTGCTVANMVYTALGRSIGTITSSHLWDFAGSLAISHNLGVNMRSLSDGTVKDSFGVDDFIIGDPKKDWNPSLTVK